MKIAGKYSCYVIVIFIWGGGGGGGGGLQSGGLFGMSTLQNNHNTLEGGIFAY